VVDVYRTTELAGSAPGGRAADLVDPTLSGGIVDRYRLVEIIGHGASSIVYRAYQPELDRMVALKVLAVDPGDDRMGERLEREARLVAGIHHPALPQIYGMGVTADRRPFIAMELLDGESLAAHLERVGRLAPREAVEIGVQIAAGLAAVHAAGYVHRDVKPSNVFLANPSGGRVVKVLDFGTARRLQIGDATRDSTVQRTLLGVGKPTIRTLPGVVFGTPWYMSPEQAAALPLGARSDQYALGVVLYEMLTGTLPFDDALPGRVLAKHIAAEPQPMSERAPDAAIPTELEGVVMRALEKNPGKRFANIAEFASALREALSAPAVARPAPTPPPPTISGGRRHRGFLAALTAAGLLALGTAAALAWLAFQSHARPNTAPRDEPAIAVSAVRSAAAADRRRESARDAAHASGSAPALVVSPVTDAELPRAETPPNAVSRTPVRRKRGVTDARPPDYSLPELKSFTDEERSP